ncbi:MAG: hypothetical protein ACT4QF_11875 [Sporichthyaceae bacterium]
MSKPKWEPRGLEDLGWRIRYRLRKAGFTVFGPAQLRPDNDPLVRLARERAARYAGRRTA